MFESEARERFLAQEGRLFGALEDLDREEARNYARKITTVLELRRLASDAGRADLVICEIASTLVVSEHSARTLLNNADMAVRHPDVYALLAEGRLRVPQLLAVFDALTKVSPERAGEVERLAIEQGLEDRPPARIHELIRRLAIRLDAREAVARRVRALADRCVSIFPGEDGVGTLWAVLGADKLVSVDKALDEMARTARRLHPDDPRTHQQWRVDLLAASVLHQIPEDIRAKTPAVQAIIEIPVTVAGDLADAPAELVGFGPIDPEYARVLLPDAELRRAFVDRATGQHLTSDDETVLAPTAFEELTRVLEDMASRAHLDDDTPEPRYRPSRRLQARVRRRDKTCSFPVCSHGSRHCDLDHLEPWPKGPTRASNLGPKSRRHHRAKQAGWRSRKSRDGTIVWTSPSGRTYRRPPEHHPPPPLRPPPQVEDDPPPF